MATSEDDIAEDVAEPATRRRQSSHRTVLSQTTRVRMVYHHTLQLECGHTELRTGGRTGATIRRVMCSSCAPTPSVVEEAKPMGWLERLITGRREQ